MVSSLDVGIEKLDAELLTDGPDAGDYAYYDDGMQRYYIVDSYDIESYVTDYLESDDEVVKNDAYSHWCAGTMAKEMPRGWTPNDYNEAKEPVAGVDEDGDCVECGHPANGSSGSGSCDAPCHGI